MITFDEAKHEYCWHGTPAPSVTQVLKAMGLSKTYPDVDFYRKRGSAVHSACAMLIKQELELEDDGTVSQRTDPRVRGYTESFRRWVARSGFRPTLIECPLYSAQWKVAGTLDYYGTLGNKTGIVDLKTGEPDPVAAPLQTAGYAILAKEYKNLPCHFRLALRLKSDGSDAEEHWFENLPEDGRYFMSAVSLYYLRKQGGLL